MEEERTKSSFLDCKNPFFRPSSFVQLIMIRRVGLSTFENCATFAKIKARMLCCSLRCPPMQLRQFDISSTLNYTALVLSTELRCTKVHWIALHWCYQLNQRAQKFIDAINWFTMHKSPLNSTALMLSTELKCTIVHWIPLTLVLSTECKCTKVHWYSQLN